MHINEARGGRDRVVAGMMYNVDEYTEKVSRRAKKKLHGCIRY